MIDKTFAAAPLGRLPRPDSDGSDTWMAMFFYRELLTDPLECALWKPHRARSAWQDVVAFEAEPESEEE